MRPIFEIEPHGGIGPVRLGMTLAEAEAALGASGEQSTEQVFWHEASFQVSFDDHGHAEFIEVAASDAFQAMFRGVALLEVGAEEAVRHVETVAPYNADHPEPGYTYEFTDLDLSLWRGVKDDPERPGFEAVGVGRAGYFSDG